MTKFRFGIIGCGRIAKRHAKHIANFGHLVAAYDTKESKSAELAGEFEFSPSSSLEDFLGRDMDVVAVCSPNGLHAEHSIAALKAGHHVICEKPMAIRSEDCERMIQVANETDRLLFVVKQNRYNPAVSIVKKKLDNGDFGQVFSVQLNCFWNRNFEYYTSSAWKGSIALDGGTLFTQFSHFIDLLYWMFGELEEVNGLKANFQHQKVIDFEDTGVLIIKFKNGVIGTINYTVNAYAKNMEGSITIFGENGTVKIGGQYLNKLEYESLAGEEIGKLPPGNPANEYGEYQGSMSNHDMVYDNVVKVLTGKSEIATTGAEGKQVVEMIERMYNAMK